MLILTSMFALPPLLPRPGAPGGEGRLESGPPPEGQTTVSTGAPALAQGFSIQTQAGSDGS